MCAGKKQQKQETVTVVTASTMQYLTQHPDTQKEGRCSEGLSVVNSCRETPGPIPNPEAKPAHADGTATGRLWESKSPPTPNNKNTTKYNKEAVNTQHSDVYGFFAFSTYFTAAFGPEDQPS